MNMGMKASESLKMFSLQQNVRSGLPYNCHCLFHPKSVHLYEVCSNQSGTPRPARFTVHIHAALARAGLINHPGDPLRNATPSCCHPGFWYEHRFSSYGSLRATTPVIPSDNTSEAVYADLNGIAPKIILSLTLSHQRLEERRSMTRL